MPPEWKRVGAFCVYKSDVYQIGKLWQKYLAVSINIDHSDLNLTVLTSVIYTTEQLIRHLIPGLHDILDCMVLNDPAQRISMAVAVTRYQTFMQNMDEAVLTLPVWQYRP